jgi:hypothetical protein
MALEEGRLELSGVRVRDDDTGAIMIPDMPHSVLATARDPPAAPLPPPAETREERETGEAMEEGGGTLVGTATPFRQAQDLMEAVTSDGPPRETVEVMGH